MVTQYDHDKYDRTESLVLHQGKTVNGELVAAGFARVYPAYCKAKFCRDWSKVKKRLVRNALACGRKKTPFARTSGVKSILGDT